ncbi:MAG: FkbM family methyltransferase [Acidobacteria bacterium]|nr:FkbM family methyltransferase [Acidobacteriota bacterium]
MPKTLLNAFLRHSNHYHAILPYNLNWAVRVSPQIRAWLEQNPMQVADVGARDGVPGELAGLEALIDYVCFDADAEECARLNAEQHGTRSFRAFPYFIAERDAPVTFHLYKQGVHSSVYPPGREFAEQFAGEEFAVQRSVQMEGTSLDAVFSKQKLAPPDFLKLDTQGSELGCLRGASQVLRQVCLVEVEVEFTPLYEGQPLFHDVMRFMTENNFELLYLNRVFGQRRAYEGPSRGQIIFGDALFGRSRTALSDLDAPKLARYALLLIHYGHLDLAHALTRDFPQILAEAPALAQYFRRWSFSPLARAGRLALSQMDKLLCLLLHARRYNQIPMDSDRGWPFR